MATKSKSLKKLTAIGKFLRFYRIDNDLRLKDMANAIGVSSAYLSACEIGNRNFSDEVISKIANVYKDIHPEEIQDLADKSKTVFKLDLSDMEEKKRKNIRFLLEASCSLSNESLEQIREHVEKSFLHKEI